MRHRNALVAEFVGLPGVGKTTVSEKVAAKLAAEDIQLITRPEILEQWHQASRWGGIRQFFPANVNHWKLLLNSLALAAQVRPLSSWSFSKALKVFSNAKRNDAVVRTENHQVVLLEQGPLQEVWAVLLKGRVNHSNTFSSTLKREIALLAHQRPMVVVYSKTDIETSMFRIKARPKKNDCPFDVMNLEVLHSSLATYFPYLQSIIKEARNHGILVLEVDASASAEAQSDEIAEWILRQVSGHRKLQKALTFQP
ncbi:MAG: AAA family ATPase [Cyanobacteria bacterium J06555_13]